MLTLFRMLQIENEYGFSDKAYIQNIVWDAAD